MNTRLINTGYKPKFDARNEAGGKAFKLSDEEALAQLVLTGTFNGTFYASAKQQLDTFKALAAKADSRYLAQLAVYARTQAFMKDTPAIILAILHGRNESFLVKRIFDQVITNGKMLRNFVQAVRSGEFGRQSFGSTTKKLIQNWLNHRSDEQLVLDSVGNSPSLNDIIKMVHPPHRRVYAYLLGRDKGYEPSSVHWMTKTSGELSTQEWKDIALNDMGFLAKIKNLNTLERNGCFDDNTFVRDFVDSLGSVPKHVMPYELFAAHKYCESGIPSRIKNALSDAMESACNNVPRLNTDPIICVDVSQSMSSPVTGYQGSATSKIRCVDVASMFASAMLRVNRNGVIIPFDTRVHNVNIDPNDSVMTNAKKLSINGGGTSCSVALAHANQQNMRSDAVIFFSDNMSWMDYYNLYHQGSTLAQEWKLFKRRNPKAKLVLVDLQPYTTTQVQTDKDILNVGGFNDQVFRTIETFISGENLLEKIKSIEVS